MDRVRCALTVLFAGAAFAAPCEARPSRDVRSYGEGGWIVTVTEDLFSGEKRCTLRSRRGAMTYQPGAVGFRVGDRDTPGAIYRIDAGQPVHWQDRYPALIAAGVAMDGPGLDDPTGRMVWIPEVELAGAQTVTIRTSTRGWGRRFRLGSATPMIAASRRLGCFSRP